MNAKIKSTTAAISKRSLKAQVTALSLSILLIACFAIGGILIGHLLKSRLANLSENQSLLIESATLKMSRKLQETAWQLSQDPRNFWNGSDGLSQMLRLPDHGEVFILAHPTGGPDLVSRRPNGELLKARVRFEDLVTVSTVLAGTTALVATKSGKPVYSSGLTVMEQQHRAKNVLPSFLKSDTRPGMIIYKKIDSERYLVGFDAVPNTNLILYTETEIPGWIHGLQDAIVIFGLIVFCSALVLAAAINFLFRSLASSMMLIGDTVHTMGQEIPPRPLRSKLTELNPLIDSVNTANFQAARNAAENAWAQQALFELLELEIFFAGRQASGTIAPMAASLTEMTRFFFKYFPNCRGERPFWLLRDTSLLETSGNSLQFFEVQGFELNNAANLTLTQRDAPDLMSADSYYRAMTDQAFLSNQLLLSTRILNVVPPPCLQLQSHSSLMCFGSQQKDVSACFLLGIELNQPSATESRILHAIRLVALHHLLTNENGPPKSVSKIQTA